MAPSRVHVAAVARQIHDLTNDSIYSPNYEGHSVKNAADSSTILRWTDYVVMIETFAQS